MVIMQSKIIPMTDTNLNCVMELTLYLSFKYEVCRVDISFTTNQMRPPMKVPLHVVI